MTTRLMVSVFLAVLFLAPPAPGDMVVPLVLGTSDSGWDAVITDDVNTGIVVDIVADDFVVIEIVKIFADAPLPGGQFTPNVITFRQRLDDELTFDDIRIADESIFNATGAEWTDYHWRLVGQAAAFDRQATDAGGFSVSPFTGKTWGPSQTGWDLNTPGAHPATLDVFGGAVADQGTFSPGRDSGPLFIDVNLSEDGPARTEFVLVQTPTPEPGTAVVVALGGLVALFRRRRRLLRQ